MSHALSITRRYDDRGDASLEMVAVALVVFAAAGAEITFLLAKVHHASSWHAFRDAAIFTVAFPVAVLLLALVVGPLVAAAEAWRRVRRRDIERRMGPLLREWLALDPGEPLTEYEIAWWRKCERRGVTMRDARRWSDQGLPYPLLFAAPGASVDVREVRALADVMHAAGAWDGRNRRKLVDLIGVHFDPPADVYPVLDRWLMLPRDRVADSVVAATASAVDQRAAGWAAQRVLYQLEKELGLTKNHRPRLPKTVHPSWEAAVSA